MSRLVRAIVAPILIAALALAGCSPASSPSISASSPVAVSPTASAAASVAAVPSGSGVTIGGDANRWCLNTVQEVSAALGENIAAMAGAEVPGLGGGCTYTTADGTPVLSLAIITSQAAMGTFNGAKLAEGVTLISGVGDEAVLVGQTGPFVIREGTVVISMTMVPSASNNDPTKVRGEFEQLGKAAVGRIPQS